MKRREERETLGWLVVSTGTAVDARHGSFIRLRARLRGPWGIESIVDTKGGCRLGVHNKPFAPYFPKWWFALYSSSTLSCARFQKKNRCYYTSIAFRDVSKKMRQYLSPCGSNKRGGGGHRQGKQHQATANSIHVAPSLVWSTPTRPLLGQYWSRLMTHPMAIWGATNPPYPHTAKRKKTRIYTTLLISEPSVKGGFFPFIRGKIDERRGRGRIQTIAPRVHVRCF